MTMQRTITAGDSFSYSVSVGDYTGYSSLLYLRGPSQVDLTGSESNGNFEFSAVAATTAAWIAGDYHYVIVIASGANQYTLESGAVEIKLRADLSQVTDVRTTAHKILDAITAVLEKRATKDQQSYSIGGRSLARMPIDELMRFEGVYRARVARENGTYKNKVRVKM